LRSGKQLSSLGPSELALAILLCKQHLTLTSVNVSAASDDVVWLDTSFRLLALGDFRDRYNVTEPSAPMVDATVKCNLTNSIYI